MNEPKLRFHKEDGTEHPEWTFASISTIGNVITGNTPSTSDASNYGDEYLFVSPVDLGRSKHIIDSVKKLSVKGFAKTRHIPKGAVLATCIGSTIGKIGMAGQDLATNQQINSIIVNANHDADFIYYALDKAFPSFLENIGNQAVPILNKSTFQNLGFLVPCLEEQQKIADFLSSIDEKIALKQKKYDALVEAKKGLLQKIFSQEIRFRKNDGGEYPEWDCVSLSEIATLYNGYAFKSSSYSPYGKYNIITIANVTGEKYITVDDKTNKITVFPDNIATHQILKQDDILISMTGNVGRVSLNKGENNLLNQRVGLLRTTENKYFVYYSIANDLFQNSMIEKGQGGAQPNIKKADILDYEIQLPCAEEQQKIADFLSAFDEKIDAVKKELEGWKEIKKGLLQQMLC